jgi:hypothetical protein
MTSTSLANDMPVPEGRALLAVSRLAIGLVHGLSLYGLHRTGELDVWPATSPSLHGSMYVAALLLPVVLLDGLGRIPAVSLRRWACIAGVLLLLLGWYDVDRQAQDWLQAPYFSVEALPVTALALFVLQQLVVSAVQERHLVATYPRYFDVAWRSGLQLALSACFVGGLWALLGLGAALFNLVGIPEFGEMIAEAWFSLPASTLTFALAVHLTDGSDTAMQGIRSLVHLLLSWLLPVIAALTAGFLLTLPFVGLHELSQQASATSLMLGAAACLVILLNAAIQDGSPERNPPLVLRVATTGAGLLLLPLIAIALWAIGARIDQHGLTPDRILAGLCALVGAVYAVGYGVAAAGSMSGQLWMRPLERTNLIAALTSVALILLCSSPLMDPASLSVAHQLRRLESGAVTTAAFDFDFLGFGAEQVGVDALSLLRDSTEPDIAKHARAAWQARASNIAARHRSGNQARPRVTVLAGEADFPDDFAVDGERPYLGSFCSPEGECLARAIDMDGDGVLEVLLANRHSVALYQRNPDSISASTQAWVRVGDWHVGICESGNPIEWMRAGEISRHPARWPDLLVGDQRISLQLHANACSQRLEQDN